jgi:hypothetical protein
VIVAVLIPVIAIPFIYSRFQPFPYELAAASIVAGLVPLALAFPLYREANTYIVTSPQGVEYHKGSTLVEALWSEVTRIGMVQVNAGHSVECLVIKSKVAPPALVKTEREHSVFIWGIPLHPFGWFWRETELGDEIRRYAPHLLNSGQEQPSKSYRQEYQ